MEGALRMTDVFVFYTLSKLPEPMAFRPDDLVSMEEVFAFAGVNHPHDDHIRSVFEKHGGSSVGSGTDMTTGERDFQYSFDDHAAAEACAQELQACGYRVDVRPSRRSALN
jgi:hypothetical protein